MFSAVCHNYFAGVLTRGICNAICVTAPGGEGEGRSYFLLFDWEVGDEIQNGKIEGGLGVKYR